MTSFAGLNGGPRVKRDLAFLKRVSAIVYPVHTIIWLTTTDWAAIAREVTTTPTLTDSGLIATPTNFQKLKIGRLMAVNSGTADQSVCDLLNLEQEKLSSFRAKHDRWAMPAGTKPDPEPAAVEAEDTHAFPEELRVELQDKLRRQYNTSDIEVIR